MQLSMLNMTCEMCKIQDFINRIISWKNIGESKK